MNSAVAVDVDTHRLHYVEDNPATLVLVEERLALRSDALLVSANALLRNIQQGLAFAEGSLRALQ